MGSLIRRGFICKVLCDFPIGEIQVTAIERIAEFHTIGQFQAVAEEHVVSYGKDRNFIDLLLFQSLQFFQDFIAFGFVGCCKQLGDKTVKSGISAEDVGEQGVRASDTRYTTRRWRKLIFL